MTTLFEGIDNAGPYFVMLVGLPGVGKSTFRNGIDEHAIVLSTDDWIQDKADWEGTTYDAIWASSIKEAESAMRMAFNQAVKDRANIIVDRTNLSAKKRKGMLAQVPGVYFKLALVFDTPDEIEHGRRLQRPGKFIPPIVMDELRERMAANPVTPEEGWDMISTVPTQ